MIGRAEGSIGGSEPGSAKWLYINGKRKECPQSQVYCGPQCALFDTLMDNKGKVVGAYLACAKFQWTFSDEN